MVLCVVDAEFVCGCAPSSVGVAMDMAPLLVVDWPMATPACPISAAMRGARVAGASWQAPMAVLWPIGLVFVSECAPFASNRTYLLHFSRIHYYREKVPETFPSSTNWGQLAPVMSRQGGLRQGILPQALDAMGLGLTNKSRSKRVTGVH